MSFFGIGPKPQNKTIPVVHHEVDDTVEFLASLAPKLVKAGAKPDNRTHDQIIDDRNRDIRPAMIDTYTFLTDEQKAAEEGRKTPAQQLAVEVTNRQIAERESRNPKR